MKIAVLVPLALAAAATAVSAQDVPIAGFALDATGRAQVQVASSADRYYVLHVRDSLPSGAERAVSMALGQAGVTMLTEPLAAYPREHYRVTEHALDAPGDIDGDGIDDVEEYRDAGRQSPFNPAGEVAMVDGAVAVPDRATFEALSYQGPDVRIDGHLADLEFVKFYLLEMDTDNPRVYFMNSVTHRAHGSFARMIGIRQGGRGQGDPPGTMRGEIVYHPDVLGRNGALGLYRFEFEPNDSWPFADVRKAYELIARNLPVLRNDLAYYPMPNAALPLYLQE